MEQSPIEKLLDENNSEPITLYSEGNMEVTFEQIAVIPLDSGDYAILKPMGEFEGIGEEEALVFEIARQDGEWILQVVLEDDIIDAVFAEYYAMLAEESGEE